MNPGLSSAVLGPGKDFLDKFYGYATGKSSHAPDAVFQSEAEFSHGICPECAKKLYS